MITLRRGPATRASSGGAVSSLPLVARSHGLVSTCTVDISAQEGEEQLQDAVRDLLVEEVSSTRQHPKRDVRQAIDCRMDVGHRDPTVPIPRHYQARDVDLTEATGHGIRIPSGHEPEHGTDVGWMSHETTIEVPGRRRHP
mgnify:CR=1 FL=1